MEGVDPGYSPAKAPVIEVISIAMIMRMMLSRMMMMTMMKMMIKITTQELAGAQMQLLRRNQEKVGKVRMTIISKPNICHFLYANAF